MRGSTILGRAGVSGPCLRAAVGLGLVAALGLPRAGSADEAAGARSPGAKDAETAVSYVPPPPAKRLEGGRVGGGTRSIRAARCGAEVKALVPADHGGLTALAQPVLHYQLSGDTDCTVRFVLNDRRQIPPLVETALPAPATAGVHAVALADVGVSLEPGVDYDWFVQVSEEGEKAPASFSGGQIRRVTPEEAGALGGRALWYDVVSDALAADASPDARAAVMGWVGGSSDSRLEGDSVGGATR